VLRRKFFVVVSNRIALYASETVCDMHQCSVCVCVLCEAVGSCAHITGLERTAHGDLTTDMCIPAFKWTIDTVLEAIERYTELQESMLNEDCSR